MKRLRGVLGIGMILLSGCGTVGGNFSGNVSVCPKVVEYGQNFRESLATELQTLPENAALVRALLDYGELRDRLRACAGK